MLKTFQEEYLMIKEEYLKGKYEEVLQAMKQKLLGKINVCFGIGFFVPVIVESLQRYGIPITCFCDTYKTGIEESSGLPIISPKELWEKFPDANILLSVANPNTQEVIKNQLETIGFSNEQILSFDVSFKFFKRSIVEPVHLELDEFEKHLEGYEWAYNFFKDQRSKEIILQRIRGYLFNETFHEYSSSDNMYFAEGIKITDHEIFVDAGMYTGDTTKEFLNRTKGKYRRIIGFDIDPSNIQLAEEALKGQPNLEIYRKGLWNKEGIMTASLGNKAGSSVQANATDTVELTTLDAVFRDCKVEDYPSFMKFDIEGSEQEALLGGKYIIETAHPQLAVCVYHKPEDIYVIPKMIYQMNPLYQFRLEHYSPYTWDTVLYVF